MTKKKQQINILHGLGKFILFYVFGIIVSLITGVIEYIAFGEVRFAGFVMVMVWVVLIWREIMLEYKVHEE